MLFSRRPSKQWKTLRANFSAWEVETGFPLSGLNSTQLVIAIVHKKENLITYHKAKKKCTFLLSLCSFLALKLCLLVLSVQHYLQLPHYEEIHLFLPFLIKSWSCSHKLFQINCIEFSSFLILFWRVIGSLQSADTHPHTHMQLNTFFNGHIENRS